MFRSGYVRGFVLDAICLIGAAVLVSFAALVARVQ